MGENIAAWNKWNFPAYVLLCDLYEVMIYVKIIYSSWVYFCIRCNLVVEFQLFLHVIVQISQHHLLKRLFLLQFMLCPHCWILTDHRNVGLFLGSLFHSIDLCVCSYASTKLFWIPWHYNILWYQVWWSLLLCSSFSKLPWLFRIIYGSI